VKGSKNPKCYRKAFTTIKRRRFGTYPGDLLLKDASLLQLELRKAEIVREYTDKLQSGIQSIKLFSLKNLTKI
jgi:hypothetical protein